MKKSCLFIPSLLLIVLCSSAQMRFTQGIVVTNDGDTLSGFVGQREGELNPSQVTYKPSEKDAERIFTVDEVRYFSIPGVVSFQRFTLAVSMDPVNLEDVDGYTAVPAMRKTVFLKVLQHGNSVTLLSYRDELKVRFYVIHSKSDEPQELVYKFLRVGAKYAEAFSFRDLLTFIAERANVMNKKLRSEINKAHYNEREILSIVSKINGINQDKLKLSDKAATGLRVGAGLNLAMLQYYGNDEFANNARSSPSILYWASVGYDLARNPYIGKLVFRADITFSTAEFTTTTHDHRYTSELDIKHSFRQSAIGVGAYALYNIHNQDDFKFFVSLGVRPNFSFYDNHYELRRTAAGSVDLIPNDDAQPKRIWLSVPLKAGVVIRRKFEIGVMYSPGMVLSYGDFLYKYGMSYIHTGLIYHF